MSAWGHHAVSQYGIAWTEPLTVTRLDLEVAKFDLGERRGSFVAPTPVLELALLERISLTARVPLAHVTYRDGTTASGIGDVGLALKVRAFATTHGELIISGGVGVELPTGDEAVGLGGGHVELAPFVTLSTAVTPRLILFGTVSDGFALDSAAAPVYDDDMQAWIDGHRHADGSVHIHDGDVHGSVLAPHSDHELSLSFGVAVLVEQAYVAGSSSVAVMWRGDQRLGPVALGGEVGWLPVPQVRLALATEVPVAGQRRFDWRGRLATAWLW